MQPSQKAVTILKSMPAAIVYEAAGKTGDMDPAIRALLPGLHMAPWRYADRIITQAAA
jgi:hypothetical protein